MRSARAAAQRLEVVLELAHNGGKEGPIIRKQVRINGVAKRGSTLVGRLRRGAVPARRRESGYRRAHRAAALPRHRPVPDRAELLAARANIQKVLAQRNALLRRAARRGGDPGQLGSGTGRCPSTAACCSAAVQAVRKLDALATDRQRNLTGCAERLRLSYSPARTQPGAGDPALRRWGSAWPTRRFSRTDRRVAIG